MPARPREGLKEEAQETSFGSHKMDLASVRRKEAPLLRVKASRTAPSKIVGHWPHGAAEHR